MNFTACVVTGNEAAQFLRGVETASFLLGFPPLRLGCCDEAFHCVMLSSSKKIGHLRLIDALTALFIAFGLIKIRLQTFYC